MNNCEGNRGHCAQNFSCVCARTMDLLPKTTCSWTLSDKAAWDTDTYIAVRATSAGLVDRYRSVVMSTLGDPPVMLMLSHSYFPLMQCTFFFFCVVGPVDSRSSQSGNKSSRLPFCNVQEYALSEDTTPCRPLKSTRSFRRKYRCLLQFQEEAPQEWGTANAKI